MCVCVVLDNADTMSAYSLNIPIVKDYSHSQRLCGHQRLHGHCISLVKDYADTYSNLEKSKKVTKKEAKNEFNFKFSKITCPRSC